MDKNDGNKKNRHNATSLNTKKMLSSTLLELMKTKPASKITVAEIARHCDINRKTFYYHFQSIEELLFWTMKYEAMHTFQNLETCTDSKELLRIIVTFSSKKRKYFISAREIDWQLFHTILYDAFHRVVRLSLEKIEKEMRKRLEENYREYVLDFYCDALSSNLFYYLEKNTKESAETRIYYMLNLLSVSLQAIVEQDGKSI